MSKFHWICLLIFLHFSHDFLAKNLKNVNFWVLGPKGPRGPKRRFFYKKGVLLFLIFFMVEKFSASYFKMLGLWTLYSINLISHGPPWRRVDHTVTVLTSATSVTSTLDLSGDTKIGPPVVLRTIMGEFLYLIWLRCISWFVKYLPF